MKLLIEAAMIFFGTLMAAALLALGGPAGVELVAAKEAPPARKAALQVLASTQSRAAQENLVARPGR